MNFEDLQKSWQSQSAAKTISINADVLLNEVRRNQQQFRATIYLRDLREVGVAAVLIPVFIYMGLRLHNWTNYLIAAACLFVGGYILFDRRRRRKTSPPPADTLKDSINASLAEIQHQIWLLENIVWWYLLPIGLPVVFSMCWPALNSRKPLLASLLFLSGPIIFVTLLYWFLYWLNQRAVKKTLRPREQELQTLLNELDPQAPTNESKPKKPLGPLLLVLVSGVIGVFCHAAGSSRPATAIDAIRENHNLPALAVVVTQNGAICDRAVAGVRKSGSSATVTTNDVFHIGSCTKSMTATVAGMFIDEGKLRWDTTIADVFPELKGKIDARYQAVTVEQLLHHRGGVPGVSPPAAWQRAWLEIGTPTEQRREFIQAVLSEPPQAAPGAKMIYSNDGYVVVGAMLEKISGEPFESLLTEKLFKPLHMDTAGFGAPGTKGGNDQPWGHRKLFFAVAAQSDNPPVHSPCGRVHCSLDDLARYAMFHLRPETNGLLKPETKARLHASPAGAEIANAMDDYACGWVRLKRGWAGGTALWHNGSNTMWYIVMWLAPEKDFSVITATNIAGPDAEKACDEVATAMIHKWLAK
jgi:CubicO group peptidase (beta-lactamase class C family)